MKLIIHILLLFIIVNSILKLSFWKWWHALLFSVGAAAFVVWTKQFAIMQSKTQLHDFMMNADMLKNVAVIITIESAINLVYSFTALSNQFGKKKKRKLMLLHWYPGILFFPVLFYLLTQAIFTFPGVDFDTLTFLLAMAIVVAIPLLRKGLKYLIPESEFRLEIHFLVTLFVAFIGLLTTVNGHVTYAATKQEYNPKALLLALIIFALTFFTGYLWNKHKWKFLQKRTKK
ncbi:MAG: hypothetical protein M0Q41_04485 [Bacteroidales bacterium]|nr:hypothetical protein [Bacteroidales bacterium]